jgi:hypothetical protein
MSLNLRQTELLQQRGIFPHRSGHRSHEITLQGLAWLTQCVVTQKKSGRMLLGDPLLAQVADMSADGARDLIVQAVRLLPYEDRPYLELIAYQGKTPPSRPWQMPASTKVLDRYEITSGNSLPFSVVEGFPSWLLVSADEQAQLMAGEILRFKLA